MMMMMMMPFFYPLNLLNIMIITLDLTNVFRLPAVIPGATQPSGEQVCGHYSLIVFITIIIVIVIIIIVIIAIVIVFITRFADPG